MNRNCATGIADTITSEQTLNELSSDNLELSQRGREVLNELNLLLDTFTKYCNPSDQFSATGM